MNPLFYLKTLKRDCFWILVVFLCFTIPLTADAVDNDAQLWATVTLKVPLSEKNYITLLASPRVGEDITNLSQMIAPRVGMFHRWNKHITTGMTGEYFLIFKPNFKEEYRLAETLLINHKALNLPVTHRLRLEQRWQEGSNTVVRMRFKNRIEKPLGEGPWYLAGSNELFINLNSARRGPQAGFEQNRLFAGFGRHFKHSEKSLAKAEVGYQLMYLNRPAPREGSFFHALFIQLSLTPF